MNQGQPAAPEDPLIGRLVEGRFKVLRKIAAGGMGVVYEAEQQPLGRRVAFKVLEILNTPGADKSFGQRFFLEANAAAKLAHPNTIVVHDYGKTDDGLYFIAMEYLDGGTLGRRLKKEGPLAPQEAIHVGMQIVSSLRDAHEAGLVHRDLKPGNVMFTPRGGDPLFVKVLDFGLVKVLGPGGQDNMQLTQSGVMMGSPRYMAPEQVKAQPCDARTDIYSFGAVFYHMLAGAPPFSAGSAFEAMNHHVYSAPPALRATWAGCMAGPRLEAVVMRCLAKEPAERFQSMDDVMNALREASHEAGGSLSGVGSYLSGSSPSSSDVDSPSAMAAPGYGSDPGSNPHLANSGVQPSAVGPAPSMVQPSIEQSKYQKTMRFDAGGMPPGMAPSTPAPMAAAPPTSSGGGALKIVLAMAVLLVFALAAAAVVFLIPMGGDEASETVAATEPAPEPEPAPVAPDPEPVAIAPATPPVQPAPAATHSMSLTTDPPGATVRREGSDLGDTPLELNIPRGERWTIEVSLEGHETRNITLQGGQPALRLLLTPEAPVRGGGNRRRQPAAVPQPQVRPLAPATQPTTRRGRGGEVYAPDLNDPWAR